LFSQSPAVSFVIVVTYCLFCRPDEDSESRKHIGKGETCFQLCCFPASRVFVLICYCLLYVRGAACWCFCIF